MKFVIFTLLLTFVTVKVHAGNYIDPLLGDDENTAGEVFDGYNSNEGMTRDSTDSVEDFGTPVQGATENVDEDATQDVNNLFGNFGYIAGGFTDPLGRFVGRMRY